MPETRKFPGLQLPGGEYCLALARKFALQGMNRLFHFTAISAHIDELILQLILAEKHDGTGLHKNFAPCAGVFNTGTDRLIFDSARIGTSAPFRHYFVAWMFRVS